MESHTKGPKYGQTRTYSSFTYVKPEKQSEDCLNTPEVSQLRQIVTEEEYPGQVCDNALTPGVVYRISGRCADGIFYADPCGLLDRRGDPKQEVEGALPDDLVPITAYVSRAMLNRALRKQFVPVDANSEAEKNEVLPNIDNPYNHNDGKKSNSIPNELIQDDDDM